MYVGSTELYTLYVKRYLIHMSMCIACLMDDFMKII